jgi:hypothetical protein
MDSRFPAAPAVSPRALSVRRKGKCLTAPAPVDPDPDAPYALTMKAMRTRHSSQLDVCSLISKSIKCALS